MKKGQRVCAIFPVLAALVVAALLLSACAGAATLSPATPAAGQSQQGAQTQAAVAKPAEKPIELTYASYIGETSVHSEQARVWAKEIEKRTNGRVKATKWQYGGAVCPGPDQLNCIARGLADFGYYAPSYNPGELRLATLSEMVYVTDVTGADARARAELYDTFPAFREEFRATGVEVLNFLPTTPGIMGITKKKTVNSSSDLMGLKFHTYGSIADVKTRVGITPVGMAIGEVYEAMSRGTIDGWWAVFWYIYPSKFFEVTGTVLDPGIGQYSGPMTVINKAKFDSMPKDVQDIVAQLRRESVPGDVKLLEKLEDDTIAKLKTEASHLKYVRLSDKTRAAWKEKANPQDLWEKFIKEREARSPGARDFFNQYLQLVKKYEPDFKALYKDPFAKMGAQVID